MTSPEDLAAPPATAQSRCVMTVSSHRARTGRVPGPASHCPGHTARRLSDSP
jgi:hypothetical protein